MSLSYILPLLLVFLTNCVCVRVDYTSVMNHSYRRHVVSLAIIYNDAVYASLIAVIMSTVYKVILLILVAFGPSIDYLTYATGQMIYDLSFS